MMVFSKIFFRYLFFRLLVPFAVCIAAWTMIYIMADLYGNIEDFLQSKTSGGHLILTILRFYMLQIPSILVQVLPMRWSPRPYGRCLRSIGQANWSPFSRVAWRRSGSSRRFWSSR